MAIKGFDFEINGVKYNAAEDAEGKSYVVQGEPLRPPNAVTVQGADSNQTFQMRPDTLLWSLSDWSGGEGTQVFNYQKPNEWRWLNAVNAFLRPGTLTPGPYLENTQHDSAGGDVTQLLMLVSINSVLYGFDQLAATYYTWNEGTTEWDGPQAITGPTSGATALCHDGDTIFWLTNDSNATLWSLAPGGTVATNLASTVLELGMSICAQNDNIYIGPDVHATPPSRKIYEVAKSGGTPVEIDSVSIKNVSSHIIPMEGKVYCFISDLYRTEIREITPTSAAGTGFGNQLALIDGFGMMGAWSHSGILFMSGQYGHVGENSLMYIQPGGSYGSLGLVRPNEAPDGDFMGTGRSTSGNSHLLEHYFVNAKRTTTEDSPSLWVVDAVSGGFANLSYPDEDLGDWNIVRALQVHKKDVFLAATNLAGTAGRVLRAVSDEYMKSSAAISAWHDFGLVSEKILNSLVLSVEALPADWTVYVDYAVDGADSWTTGITYIDDDGTGATALISTDSTTVKFSRLSIRIRMEYGGAGVPTTAPVVLGVDALARVVKLQKVHLLNLDLSDDHSGKGTTGAKKRKNILTAADLENVIDFKDGYIDRSPNTFDQLDVVIDGYQLDLSRPGEGVCQVVLKEII